MRVECIANRIERQEPAGVSTTWKSVLNERAIIAGGLQLLNGIIPESKQNINSAHNKPRAGAEIGVGIEINAAPDNHLSPCPHSGMTGSPPRGTNFIRSEPATGLRNENPRFVGTHQRGYHHHDRGRPR